LVVLLMTFLTLAQEAEEQDSEK